MSDVDKVWPAPPPATDPVVATPMVARNPVDLYALLGLVLAFVGLVIPLMPAAAALMLVRAVDNEPEVAPRTRTNANLAATVAYVALAFQAALCLFLLIGVAFKAVG